MKNMTHTYDFEPIQEQWSSIRSYDSHTAIASQFEVKVRDGALLSRHFSSIPPIIADLLDIAVAVHAGDRVSEKYRNLTCNIQITLPVRCPEIFEQPKIVEKLHDVLYWYTGCDWSFRFIKRYGLGRESEQKLTLPMPDISPIAVSLWSGGLDALAGLYHQIVTNKNMHFVLAGSGSSLFVHGKQAEIAQAIASHFPGRTELSQLPIYLRASTGELPERPRLRSRGFVFMLVGAVIAYLKGQTTLYIYENGIGAINLPFRSSEVGLDHARSVHPLSLLYMSEMLSQILLEPFEFQNPFLFQTKAQVCKSIIEDGLIDLACATVTCDRRHRKKNAQQCGRCSSCVLRRQTFAVLGVEDKTTYVFSDFATSTDTNPICASDHLPAMLEQLETLRSHLNAEDPWRSLTRQFNTLAFDVVDQTPNYSGISSAEMRDGLLELYGQYVREWDFIK